MDIEFGDLDSFDFDFDNSTDMDDFISGGESRVVHNIVASVPPKQKTIRKISSLKDLDGFRRINANELIRKSERDLWAIRKGDDGSLFIERLFDDDGNPLKGL